jgi:hypothetical protein
MVPMIRHSFPLAIILSMLPLFSWSQTDMQVRRTNSDVKWQYGLSANLMLQLEGQSIVGRVVIAAGLGASFAGVVMPSYHAELHLFNRGLGAAEPQSSRPYLDLIQSFTMTLGCGDGLKKPSANHFDQWAAPLFYFGDFTQPPLVNPFNASVSFGTDLAHSLVGNRSFRYQRIGFINLHYRRVQFSYSNDGGGIEKIFLGDGEDRGYTGGGILSYTFDRHVLMSQVDLSFYRFTGWNRESFQTSNKLGLPYTIYPDANQHLFNRGLYRLNIRNAATGTHLYACWHNALHRSEFQNLIHYSLWFAYHYSPYPTYLSLGLGHDGMTQKLFVK